MEARHALAEPMRPTLGALSSCVLELELNAQYLKSAFASPLAQPKCLAFPHLVQPGPYLEIVHALPRDSHATRPVLLRLDACKIVPVADPTKTDVQVLPKSLSEREIRVVPFYYPETEFTVDCILRIAGRDKLLKLAGVEMVCLLDEVNARRRLFLLETVSPVECVVFVVTLDRSIQERL